MSPHIHACICVVYVDIQGCLACSLRPHSLVTGKLSLHVPPRWLGLNDDDDDDVDVIVEVTARIGKSRNAFDLSHTEFVLLSFVSPCFYIYIHIYILIPSIIIILWRRIKESGVKARKERKFSSVSYYYEHPPAEITCS